MVKKRSEMTPEELKKAQAYQREYQQNKRANMTPKQKAELSMRQRAYRERRKARMTPEEKDAERECQREYQREYHRVRRANLLLSMSQEERDEYHKALYEEQKIRAWRKKLSGVAVAPKEKRVNRNKAKRRADMTTEQLEAVRTYQREYHRQYRANLTPEQREKKRAKAKAYMRDYLQEKADKSKRAKLDAVLAKVGLAGNEREDMSQ